MSAARGEAPGQPPPEGVFLPDEFANGVELLDSASAPLGLRTLRSKTDAGWEEVTTLNDRLLAGNPPETA